MRDRDPIPWWLPILRAADYRLDALPPDQRRRVAEALAAVGIDLPGRGAIWPSHDWRRLTP